jgi:Mrp family chromosome partitioning ATPase
MSRNFEVLLRAGKEEKDMFQDVVPEMPHSEPRVAPPRRRPQIHIDPAVRTAEVNLVQRVFLLPGRDAPRAAVFCGVEEDNGAAGICARCAEHLSDLTSSPVCLVDGDLQFPRLHDYFGLDNLEGLTDFALEPGQIRDFVRRLPGRNVYLLSHGSRQGGRFALGKSNGWRQAVTELRKEFAFVLIGGPPVNTQADPMLLGQSTDGVVLVLESNVTRRETARKAKESLAAANVQLLGAVLNNRTFPIPESIYRKL